MGVGYQGKRGPSIETFPIQDASSNTTPTFQPPPPPNTPAELRYDATIQLPGPRQVKGVLSRHSESHDMYDGPRTFVPADGLAAGAQLVSRLELGFEAKTAIIDNLTNYVLMLDSAQRVIPAGATGVVLPLFPALKMYSLRVISGGNATGQPVIITLTERIVPPATSIIPQSASGTSNVSVVTPLPAGGNVIGGVTLPAGQAVELLDAGGANKAAISAAGRLSVDGSGVTQPVSGSTTALGSHAAALNQGTTSNDTITAEDGAPVGACSQVSVLITTTQLLAANANRKGALFVNHDAVNPVYLNYTGAATTLAGPIIFPRASIPVTFKGVINAIATGGTVIVGVIEESWN